MMRRLPKSTLFPYTTLFRSWSSATVRGPTPSESITQPRARVGPGASLGTRSEEHTSELQSHVKLVCRLLLEKKERELADGAGLSGIGTLAADDDALDDLDQ